MNNGKENTFTYRELSRLGEISTPHLSGNPGENVNRLLLVYAIECGLKAVWLRQTSRSLFDADDISKTGHDLNEIIKQLHLGKRLSPQFDLADAHDERHKRVPRKGNSVESLHQVWRYGGRLVAPVDDAGMEAQLEAVHRLIEKVKSRPIINRARAAADLAGRGKGFEAENAAVEPHARRGPVGGLLPRQDGHCLFRR